MRMKRVVKCAVMTCLLAVPMSGWIFEASGETAYVNIQHRTPNIGAVLKITGFKVK